MYLRHGISLIDTETAARERKRGGGERNEGTALFLTSSNFDGTLYEEH
jgi:hypothetical protein